MLRLKSYLTETVEAAYTFEMDQGSWAKTEGLRQAVSRTRQQANVSPCRPHAEQGSIISPFATLFLLW